MHRGFFIIVLDFKVNKKIEGCRETFFRLRDPDLCLLRRAGFCFVSFRHAQRRSLELLLSGKIWALRKFRIKSSFLSHYYFIKSHYEGENNLSTYSKVNSKPLEQKSYVNSIITVRFEESSFWRGQQYFFLSPAALSLLLCATSPMGCRGPLFVCQLLSLFLLRRLCSSVIFRANKVNL